MKCSQNGIAVGAGLIATATLVLAACSASQGTIPPGMSHAGVVRRAASPKYIYVTDVEHSQLFVYPAGVPNPTPSATTVPEKPHGVVTDANGNVYVASSESDAIEVYNSGATMLVRVIISPFLDKPQGLALDADGDLYAANPHNNTVVEFSPGGNIEKALFRTLASPEGGITTDSAGNLYVDDSNGDVELCQPSSGCTTIPGVTGPGFGGLAFVPGFLAVCGGNLINYYAFPGWKPGQQNVNYYQSDTSSRFMTSDSMGTLYIPFAPGSILPSPPPAAVVVVRPGGAAPYTITSGLQQPFGAAAGP